MSAVVERLTRKIREYVVARIGQHDAIGDASWQSLQDKANAMEAELRTALTAAVPTADAQVAVAACSIHPAVFIDIAEELRAVGRMESDRMGAVSAGTLAGAIRRIDDIRLSIERSATADAQGDDPKGGEAWCPSRIEVDRRLWGSDGTIDDIIRSTAELVREHDRGNGNA